VEQSSQPRPCFRLDLNGGLSTNLFGGKVPHAAMPVGQFLDLPETLVVGCLSIYGIQFLLFGHCRLKRIQFVAITGDGNYSAGR